MKLTLQDRVFHITAGVLGVAVAILVAYISYSLGYMDDSADSSLLAAIGKFSVIFVFLTGAVVFLAIAVAEMFDLEEYQNSFFLAFAFALVCSMITNQLFLTDFYERQEFVEFDKKIIENNEGMKPQTAFYSRFKQEQAANDYKKLRVYKTEVGQEEFFAIDSDKAAIVKLAGENLKNPQLKALFDEINADGFISVAEYKRFKYEVLKNEPQSNALVVALRNET